MKSNFSAFVKKNILFFFEHVNIMNKIRQKTLKKKDLIL